MNGEGQSLWPAGLDGVRPATPATVEAGAELWGGVGTCGQRSETEPAMAAGTAAAGEPAGAGNQAGDAGELVPPDGSGGGEADADFGPGGPGQDEQSGWRNNMGLMEMLGGKLRTRRESKLALWREYRAILVRGDQATEKQADRLLVLLDELGLRVEHVVLHRQALAAIDELRAVAADGASAAADLAAIQARIDAVNAEVRKLNETLHGAGTERELLGHRKQRGANAEVELERLRMAFPALLADDATAQPDGAQLSGQVYQIAANTGLLDDLQGRGYAVE